MVLLDHQYFLSKKQATMLSPNITLLLILYSMCVDIGNIYFQEVAMQKQKYVETHNLNFYIIIL